MDTKNLDNKVKKDFINYANAVIKSRAISKVEDNLKPVHRRILYTMAENKLWSNKKTVKSNNIVGKVMIRHPHGDSSIYDATIRMAQPWKMRYPLVEVQGNAGNISGDGPAAMRYTEIKLSRYGQMMLEDIDKDCVDFRKSYDETTTEPVVLPSKFPNILCNGNAGIAVGISTSLVPHNLTEVVNAITAYIKNKSITVEQLMKHIPAPDFPTGGTIMNTDNMKEIYETGRGTIVLRSKYDIEQVKDRQHIVITEIPYLVSTESGIIDQLKKLVIEEGFDLIDDFKDRSSMAGINLRIILKKGANVYKVLETLWKHTRLQITQRISNTVIVKGNPQELSLKEMIAHYVEHRHDVIKRIADNELGIAQRRIIVVNGLIKAMDKIDDVVEIIKKSADRAAAASQLMTLLDINSVQADAILNMRLGSLSKLDSMELKNELAKLQEKEKELLEISTKTEVRDTMIQKELTHMRLNLSDERRTNLVYGVSEAEEGYAVEPVKILMFSGGSTYLTQNELEDLSFSKKNDPLNHDGIALLVETETDKTITVFKQDGTMTSRKVITMTKDTLENGTFNTQPLAAFDFDSEDTKDYIVFVTSGGLVKKTATSEYIKAKEGSRTIKLKGDQELIFVGMANNDDNIAVLGEKLSFFKVSQITPTSKLTLGSKANKEGMALSAAIVSDDEKLLTINSDGKGKLTKASDLVQTSKGGAGQVITDDTIIIHAEKSNFFIYDGVKNNYYTKRISTKGKAAVGSKILNRAPVLVAG